MMMHKLLSHSARGPKIAQVRATRWHVKCSQMGMSSRSLHSELDELSPPGEARTMTSAKKRVNFPPRQVTLSVENDPDQVTMQQVVHALLKFQMQPKLIEQLPKRQAVVILATPTFASWLEASSEFIPKALQRIVGTANSPEVDVVCACVDGLAQRPEWMRFMKDDTEIGEGFAILHLTKGKFYDFWENNTTLTSPNLQSTLTFMTGRTKNDVTITLPLANTLFKNGRHSTLLVSRWRSSGDSFIISKEQTEKHNFDLGVFGRLAGRLPRTHIRMVPLTPVRRIISGLGNIVRRIEFGEGDVGPASRELETSATEYLAQLGHDRSKIDVWALVIPEAAFSGRANGSEKISMGGVEDVRVKWSSSALDHQYVGNWLDKGARLYRVLSGGGGWGPKQGLLSLDPQTTYSAVNESGFDFLQGSLDEQQASALGNIAQEGFIQFLVAAQNKSTGSSLKEITQGYTNSTRRSTVVGAIPSTVDEIQSITHEKQLNKEKPKDGIQVYLGHFGCVSESGMFLHRPLIKSKIGQKAPQRDMPIIETKIDVPYSYIYRDNVKNRRQISGCR